MKPSNQKYRRVIGFATLAFLLIPAAFADTWDKKTHITFREAVEFPGGTVLAPGNYVMKLADSASNRHIVQVFNDRQDRLFATVFTNPVQRTEPAERTVVTFYETPQDRPPFIHTWFYPGDITGEEFPYPKNRARFKEVAAAGVPPLIAAAAPEPAAPVRPDPEIEDAPVAARPALEPPAPRSDGIEAPGVSDVNRSEVPENEPELLAQANPQPAVPQAPRPDAAQGDATTPADELPATASDAPYWGIGSLLLLAIAFSLRMARWSHG